MSNIPTNPNGSATSANSSPVVVASDQATLPVSLASVPAHAVSQSGTWTVQPGNTANTTAWKVDGSAVTQPVSAASLPLPSGAATSAAQTTGNSSLSSIDTKTPALGQALAAASVPVVLPTAQITTLTPPAAITGFALDATLSTTNTEIGGLTETAPASDTASSGLNGRLQRIAQRLTSLIALLPTALGAGGGLKVDGSGTALPVSLSSVPSHAVTNAGTFAVQATEADGANTTLGSKADAKSTATDATAVTVMQVLKQISASVQAPPSQAVTGTFWQATQPVSGTVTTTPPSNASSNIAQINGVTPLMGNGVTGTGSQRVTIASDNTAFTVNAAQSGTWTMQPGNTANTTPWLMTPAPATSGGPSKARVMSAASTNATSTKASAGQVYGWYFYNNTALAKFVKFYNKASSPTVGTDTPTETLAIPANSGTNIQFSMGVPYATGIAYAITGGIADSDTTAVAANDVTGFFLYK